ncbi:MAG: lactonase family protein [Verrucomicrobia bacterium]|nr:lactonase family protein [Verrucomicrobiota bacterium]
MTILALGSLTGALTTVLLLGCALAASAQTDGGPAERSLRVYFGTYTGAKSRGIYVSRLDLASGALSPPLLAAESSSPSFLALHPNGRFIYAVNELNSFGGKRGGAVSAFALDPVTGKLSLLNEQPSGGPGPCHLAVDHTGKVVLVANYNGGSIEMLPLLPDGRLGEPSAFVQHQGSSVNPQRQEGPHAHCAAFDPANRFAFVCDLGLDKVMVYRFDPNTGTLTPNNPPWTRIRPGSGPRHLVFAPGGRFAYVISEMACTLTALRYDARQGTLAELQTLSTLPDGESVKPDYSTAEVLVHPSGKFLYGSNRGQNSIVVCAIDPRSGKLTRLQNQPTQGRTPRGCEIDPTGACLVVANQDSDNVVVFRIDPETGRLQPAGSQIEVGAPVSVLFVPNRSSP